MDTGVEQRASLVETVVPTVVRPLPAALTRIERPRPTRRKPLYAALDLGTNNCRLLIAEADRNGFQVVDAFSRIVRLGEGLSRTGILSDAAQSRAIEALRVCREKVRGRGVRRARFIATEACRAAANGHAFIERVRREVGLRLEIVDRETEARLAVTGCASLVDPAARGVLLFDIGGGSSELAWLACDGDGRTRRQVDAWTSLPFGVVTLAERFGGVDIDHVLFQRMVEEVTRHTLTFEGRARIGQGLAGGNAHLLGTSGTVTTLAGLHLGLKRYDRRRVDGLWLDAACISELVGRILSMSYAERVASPCIGSDRADLVLAGCAILEAIRRTWPCDRLRVADRGLREGILITMIAEDRRRRNERRRNRRRRQAAALSSGS